MVETVMWESLVPRILLSVSVPMLSAAALAILVHPTGPVVAFSPRPIPAVSVFSFPPRLPLLHPLAIRIKILVPFIAPFGPTITLEPLSPLVSIFRASTITIVLLTPPKS